MKLRKIVSFTLVVLMLVPCFCFTSCSFGSYDIDKALSNYMMIEGKLWSSPSAPAVQNGFQTPDGGMLVFDDTKSAKLYEKVLKNENEIKKMNYETDCKMAKWNRKRAANWYEWYDIDRDVTEYLYQLDKQKDWKVERKGNVICYGYPSFFNAIEGIKNIVSVTNIKHSLCIVFDEIQAAIMNIYFDIAPQQLPKNNGPEEYDAFFTAANDVFDELDISVLIDTYPDKELAKIKKEYRSEDIKLRIKEHESTIKYYEYVLDEYGDVIDADKYDSIRQRTTYLKEEVSTLKDIVIAQSGCLVFIGDPFDVAVAYVINFAPIRWMLSLDF